MCPTAKHKQFYESWCYFFTVNNFSMKTFHAIITNYSFRKVSARGIRSVKSVVLLNHLFPHGCGKLPIRKGIIEFGFHKLYIEFSQDGIGKYFNAKNLILYVVIFKDYYLLLLNIYLVL